VPPSINATRRLRSCFPKEAKPPHLADPAVDLADAVQGRDRSSSSELRTLDSIDARFQFLKTRFRVVVFLFTCHRATGLFRILTQVLLAEGHASVFDLVVSIRWSVRDSNPRPPACKADALPAELTPRLGLPASPPDAVGLERFELSTPRLSSVCSNQLSYRPRPKVSGKRHWPSASAPVGPSKLNSKIEKNP
jgi:hypothetical protein